MTVDSTGALTSGSTSGTITFTGLTANTTYTLSDAIESLGTTHMYVGGSYTLSFSSACASGSATSGTYTVVGGTSTFPTAPVTSGTLATITTDATGTFSCSYTLTYPTISSSNDSMCDGHLCAVRNDAFVISGTTQVTQVASASVLPGGAPPTTIPEAPSPILLPLGILLVAGVGTLLWRRRLITQS